MLNPFRPMKLDLYYSDSRARHKKSLVLSNFIEKAAHFLFSFTNFVDTKNNS